MSSALAGGFLTAAPPGEPFSPSCKDMALDLRSTLIQCDLTLIHFVSKDTVSKRGPTVGFWVDLNFVVTLFIQCIWKLKSNPHPKCKVPTPFPTENISEGTFCTKTKFQQAALSFCLVVQGPQLLPFTPATASCRPPVSASLRKGPSQNSELGNRVQATPCDPRVILSSEPQLPLLSVRSDSTQPPGLLTHFTLSMGCTLSRRIVGAQQRWAHSGCTASGQVAGVQQRWALSGYTPSGRLVGAQQR